MHWAEIDAAYYPGNILAEPPYRFVSLVYAWAVPQVDPEQREDWEMELDDLLPWQDSQSEAAEQLESDTFLANMGRGG